MRSIGRVAVVLVVAVCGGAVAADAQVVFQGVEFQVNTYTPDYQTLGDVAGDDAGFVVTWVSPGQDGSAHGVFARRFSSVGTALGVEFQVNVRTTGVQTVPAIAIADSGFVVVWASSLQDGDATGIFGRRYTSTGTPLAGEFQVNTRTTGEQVSASVAAMTGGGFVVVWDSPGDYDQQGVFAQRFSSSGTRLGEELLVNHEYITGAQYGAVVATEGEGFVVVWHSAAQDGDAKGLFGQRFDSLGFFVGNDFQVSTHTVGIQGSPSVASTGSGFVVAFVADDLSGYGVYGRRFDSSGVGQSSEFRINAAVAPSQIAPDIATRGGSFLVAWDVYNVTHRIGARRLDGLGFPDGSDVQVNIFSNGNQSFPRVARAGSGFVVVWSSKLQESTEWGVFGRRLAVLADFDIDGNGAVEPLTDGLLALRYGFGFRGATLINGAVGAGCSRCSAPSIEAYLASRF